MLTRDRLVVFHRFLLPSIVGMLGTALYVLGDTMIVGRGLGRDGLAALNLSIPMINIMNGVGLLVGLGGSSLISQARGADNEGRARRYFTASTMLAASSPSSSSPRFSSASSPCWACWPAPPSSATWRATTSPC